jgi:hypothetical protein
MLVFKIQLQTPAQLACAEAASVQKLSELQHKCVQTVCSSGADYPEQQQCSNTPEHTRKDGVRTALNVVWLLFMLFYLVFVCKCVLPPGDNPFVVNKYININKGTQGKERYSSTPLAVGNRRETPAALLPRTQPPVPIL